MELMTIGEAAQMLALNTSALRYYEDRGLLTPQSRLAIREWDAPTTNHHPEQQQHGQGWADHPPYEPKRDDRRREHEQHHAGVLLDDRESASRSDPVDFLCHGTRMPAVDPVWFP